MEIRDHRGLKVPWRQRGRTDETLRPLRSALPIGQGLSLDVPAYGLRVTANEGLFITLTNGYHAPQGSLRRSGGMVTFLDFA